MNNVNKIILVTEPNTLSARPNGTATANIWLEINGIQFPMLRWNDFAVVVMSWWAIALLRLLRGTSILETVNFMDGPYTVEVSISSPGMLQIRALRRCVAQVDEVATGEEPTTPFILGLISQSSKILDACKRQGWWSKDAEILESSLEALREESGLTK